MSCDCQRYMTTVETLDPLDVRVERLSCMAVASTGETSNAGCGIDMTCGTDNGLDVDTTGGMKRRRHQNSRNGEKKLTEAGRDALCQELKSQQEQVGIYRTFKRAVGMHHA